MRFPFLQANAGADLQITATIAFLATVLAIWTIFSFSVWIFFGLFSTPFFYSSVRHSSIWQTASTSDKIDALRLIVLFGILAPITLKNPEEFLIESIKIRL